MIRGFACGVFDLFHMGHLIMIEDCKKYCDHLTIAVNSCENLDPEINAGKMPIVFPLEHRVKILQANQWVDEVITYSTEEELTDIMRIGNYDVRFLGEDYKGKKITAPNLIQVVYLSRSHGFSTSKFKKDIHSKMDNWYQKKELN